VSAAQDKGDKKQPSAGQCKDNLERTRRLIAELKELADASRSACDQDGCLLLYGVVEDCCLRIGSLLDWRAQRLQTQGETEAATAVPANQANPGVSSTSECEKE
jgi:hypothetical protein